MFLYATYLSEKRFKKKQGKTRDAFSIIRNLREGGNMKFMISCFLIVLFFSSGRPVFAGGEHDKSARSTIKRAVAVINPTKGNSVHGKVTFEEQTDGIRVVANLSGLIPGKHGFHVHEFGDISSEDGSSAGGHFNPHGMPHSMPMDKNRHTGDMGNIEADSKGNAYLDYTDKLMKLNGDYSIIGRAVVVHEKEDDLKTQPAGNAGARIGFGVIGVAK
jgi:superoxide dismutase, Cu-Zn family